MRAAWHPLTAAGAVHALLEEDAAVLFEVRLPARRDLAASLREAVLHRPTTTLLGTPLAPLPPGALNADVVFPPLLLSRGASLRVTPTVRNTGDVVWPGLGVWPSGLVVIDVRWTDANGRTVGPPALGVRLPRDLAPGDAATVEAFLLVPRVAGSYRLEARLRQVDHEAQGDPVSVSVVIPH